MCNKILTTQGAALFDSFKCSRFQNVLRCNLKGALLD
jgi:hypothetical protein